MVLASLPPRFSLAFANRVGFLGLAAGIVELVQKHSWNWQLFGSSLLFAATSFQTPERRFHICEARPGRVNLVFSTVLVLAIAGGVYLWFRFAMK